MRRKLLTTAAIVALASMSACTTTTVTREGVSTFDGEARADVNPNYAVGRLDSKEPHIPSLEEMQEIRKVGRDPSVSSTEDRLRAPALRDAALSYGARGGLAWASQQINRSLEDQAPQLSRTFDFNRFLIRQPAGDVTLLPPVIVESRETYEQADAGRTLRVADRFYEILEQARFAPVAPLWHTYLIRHYSIPERPQDGLIPKNEGERDLWRAFVASGWDKGVEQARQIFRDDMRRLERDYSGMIRYSELLERGEVTPPVVASQSLGVTGSGKDMRVNDDLYRITKDPRLNVQRPSDWKAPASPLDPTDAGTPPGDAPGTMDH